MDRWQTSNSVYGYGCTPKRGKPRKKIPATAAAAAATAAAAPPPAGPPPPRSSCAVCGGTPVPAVTAAAMHESWGLKWNTCDYSCTVCRKKIAPGVVVDACSSCKTLWHREC